MTLAYLKVSEDGSNAMCDDHVIDGRPTGLDGIAESPVNRARNRLVIHVIPTSRHLKALCSMLSAYFIVELELNSSDSEYGSGILVVAPRVR